MQRRHTAALKMLCLIGSLNFSVRSKNNQGELKKKRGGSVWQLNRHQSSRPPGGERGTTAQASWPTGCVAGRMRRARKPQWIMDKRQARLAMIPLLQIFSFIF
jgi:hypothetical protein